MVRKMEDAMDDAVNNGQSAKAVPVNGDINHLPTPALSPITEHGASEKGQRDAEKTPVVDTSDTAYFDGALDGWSLSKASKSRGVTRRPASSNDDAGRHARRVDLGQDSNKFHEANELSKEAPPLSSPTKGATDHKSLKLSPAQIYRLTSSPGSIPIRATSPITEEIPFLDDASNILDPLKSAIASGLRIATPEISPRDENGKIELGAPLLSVRAAPAALAPSRPTAATRSNSSPLMRRKHSSIAPRNPVDPREQSKSRRPTSSSIKLGESSDHLNSTAKPPPLPAAAPVPNGEPSSSSGSCALPLPPLSLPTYLQLELSSERPSALYIHRSSTTDVPYESSKVKFDRLYNFLKVPFQLEQILLFGALACLDAWLYTFTILPLRFFKALFVWLQWWFQFVTHEVKDIASFIYTGVGRLWQRKRQGSVSVSRSSSVTEPFTFPTPNVDGVASPRVNVRVDESGAGVQRPTRKERKPSTLHRHRRSRSTPSALLPNHKADLLQGMLIVISCMILLRLDASRIYHNIRGQSAIKLYVIYNSLEVFDRLFSAIGQDVLECLFSKETLERKPNGRSKVIRPFWMFVLALFYNTIHAAALFYQVITLNVAVNSYSNALLTLLMSNQFVEIKGAVFKKLEKENLFQMTCADVVERFQLWLMLLIIAMRNIVEVGGLSMNFGPTASPTNFTASASGPSTQSMGILPQAFTLIPKWSGQILGPFLIVLGSEMAVDYLKHAYINKFNSISPAIYSRFLDVLAKDYYSNAFADQNLMKRLGLPVLPLACLFIRAAVQTYHMFVATHMPLPIASTATALAVDEALGSAARTSPATTAVLAHIDMIFRRALGRSSFGAGPDPSASSSFSLSLNSLAFSRWSIDDIIAFATMLVFFLMLYFFLLALKLVLGMLLLGFARSRYEGMRERERAAFDVGSRRVGGLGQVEVDEEKRRWIYGDDEEGLRVLRAREAKGRERREREAAAAAGGGGGGDGGTGGGGGGGTGGKAEVRLEGVNRYMMVAKRIW